MCVCVCRGKGCVGRGSSVLALTALREVLLLYLGLLLLSLASSLPLILPGPHLPLCPFLTIHLLHAAFPDQLYRTQLVCYHQGKCHKETLFMRQKAYSHLVRTLVSHVDDLSHAEMTVPVNGRFKPACGDSNTLWLYHY